jgi:ApeA N-terminal domain 1
MPSGGRTESNAAIRHIRFLSTRPTSSVTSREMPLFNETFSALGHFWPQGKPDNCWPGRVSIDQFPTAKLHCLNRIPGDGVIPKGYQTICGTTEDGQHVTMFEAYCAERGLTLTNTTRTHQLSVTSNFMLVGATHFTGSESVKRLTFSSVVVEHVLRLKSNFFPHSLPRTFSADGLRRRQSHKQVVSYFDPMEKVRFRIVRSLTPSSGMEPTSLIIIDFHKPLRPKDALTFLHHFRQLLTVICGDLIDLWDVKLLHLGHSYLVKSELYFADQVEKSTNSTWFPITPLIDIARRKDLFRRILRNWLTESPSPTYS